MVGAPWLHLSKSWRISLAVSKPGIASPSHDAQTPSAFLQIPGSLDRHLQPYFANEALLNWLISLTPPSPSSSCCVDVFFRLTLQAIPCAFRSCPSKGKVFCICLFFWWIISQVWIWTCSIEAARWAPNWSTWAYHQKRDTYLST